MITLIEARHYRCLRQVSRPLKPFQILVGPNASGKTTFLDVISFLGDFVSGGLDNALLKRTQNLEDLIWRRTGKLFDLAIEASIPEEFRVAERPVDTVRYHVALDIDERTKEVKIALEAVVLRLRSVQQEETHPEKTVDQKASENEDIVVVFNSESESYFLREQKGRDVIELPIKFRFGPRKSALGNLPEDEIQFPVATWLKGLLVDGVQSFILNSALIKKASASGQSKTFKPDGSNLPWVIESLLKESPDRFNQWISHVQTALPDIEGIRTVLREDDRHRYLMVRYRGGLEIPSWMVSDGTLRLLALTLPAYLTDFKGIYLIEEPENGIHPRAVETVFQSLSSVYNAQILLATHSPVILSVAEAKDVLCFSKNDEGATDIVSGDQHPALRDWKGQTNLGDLFASGVLG